MLDESFYREQIIDLYENPLNHGELDPCDFSYEEDNPFVAMSFVLMFAWMMKAVWLTWPGVAMAVPSARLRLHFYGRNQRKDVGRGQEF